ncbi:EpsG family protein [Providencia rettgeri]|uniref:EpsG family protein n=1 Tax=Providencia rettgeri TaxID=587 RepID=UPI0035251FE7
MLIINKEKALKFAIYPIICLFYASILSNFPSELFRDRVAYLRYAEKGIELFSLYGFDIKKIIFNEPLFLVINEVLSIIFEPDKIIQFLVFFISFTFSYFICFHARNINCALLGLLLLFIIPQSFHAQLVILRQSLAVSILLWSIILFDNKKYILLTSLFCCFIHSSFFIFTPLLFVGLFFNFNERYKYFFYPFCYALLITFSAHFLSSVLGLRQADQNQALASNDVSVSGFGFILWGVATIVLASRNKILNNNVLLLRLTVLFLIFYCSLYFISPISGRVFSALTTLIIASLVYTFHARNILYVIILILLSMITFEQSVINNSFL